MCSESDDNLKRTENSFDPFSVVNVPSADGLTISMEIIMFCLMNINLSNDSMELEFISKSKFHLLILTRRKFVGFST